MLFALLPNLWCRTQNLKLKVHFEEIFTDKWWAQVINSKELYFQVLWRYLLNFQSTPRNRQVSGYIGRKPIDTSNVRQLRHLYGESKVAVSRLQFGETWLKGTWHFGIVQNWNCVLAIYRQHAHWKINNKSRDQNQCRIFFGKRLLNAALKR